MTVDDAWDAALDCRLAAAEAVAGRGLDGPVGAKLVDAGAAMMFSSLMLKLSRDRLFRNTAEQDAANISGKFGVGLIFGSGELMLNSLICIAIERRTHWVTEVIGPTDLVTIRQEMSIKGGRADISVFHADGTATIIEVKDGSHGAMHVAKGIGQVGLYAAQVALSGALKGVKRCLAWSSAGEAADAEIKKACEDAGVLHICLSNAKKIRGKFDDHLAARFMERIDLIERTAVERGDSDLLEYARAIRPEQNSLEAMLGALRFFAELSTTEEAA